MLSYQSSTHKFIVGCFMTGLKKSHFGPSQQQQWQQQWQQKW